MHNRKFKHLKHKKNIIYQLLKVSQAPEHIHDLFEHFIFTKESPIDAFRRGITQCPHQHVLLHDYNF